MATMDELRPAILPDLDQARASKVSPSELRRRAHEILSTQRSQLDRFEHELNERLQQLGDQIAQDLASNQAEQVCAARQSVEGAEVEPLREQLAARETELTVARAALDDARLESKRLEQDTRIHEALLVEAQKEQEERRVAWTAFQEQLADAQAQLAAARIRQEELCLELAGERERASAEREKTKTQRRRIAREFKSQHAARLVDFERRKAELQALAAAGQSQFEAQCTLAQTEVTRAMQAELNAARAEVEQARISTKRLEQDARIHEALLAEAQKEREERRVAWTVFQEQLADAHAQLAAARKRQEELCLELAGERERASAEREQTKTQRRRIAREFKSQHAARLADFEKRKAELQALAAAGQSQLEAQYTLAQTEVARALQAELDAARAEVEQAKITTKRLEQDARIHEALLDEAQKGQEQRRVASTDLQEQLADAQAQLAAARKRQEELRHELADERECLSAEQDKTKAERRDIARELKTQHAARLAELEQRKAELQALTAASQTQLEGQLATVNSELSQTRQQLAELRKLLDESSDELAQTREQAIALKTETAQLRESLQMAQAKGDRAGEALSQAETTGESDREELNKLLSEREGLVSQLAAAEARLKEVSKVESGLGKRNDLQRRFEMAVEELREMKLAHAELEAKLVKTRAGGAGSGSNNSNGMDWAAQKQRLLASLEADNDDDDDTVAEHTTIEGTIRITDEIVTQKDREIAELNRLLQEQSNHVGSGAAGAAAVKDALDHDEIILQEREKLRQVQAEWREKIGKAEIDISMERAKIARDRAELEEKMRSHQHEQATRAPEDPRSDSQGKPIRGRWLARLGLKELGEP
jgi:hypothetical protein